ncbi:MAG: helix-hairpin-helix domain-containing protein [Myxococcales bacterium]|nr:helix-hairpin-helix domain-containing protein [Myxococcales bacterium]
MWARHGVGALALAAAVVAGQARLGQPGGEARPWVDAVGIDDGGVLTLHHGVGPLVATLVRCPPDAPIHPGSRLRVEEGPAGCRTRVTPLPAPLRLALGVPLDVNQATVDELRAVSGLGPALAARVVAGRPYARLADLERVRGVGPVRRARLAPHLTPAPLPLLWPSGWPPAASTPRRP